MKYVAMLTASLLLGAGAAWADEAPALSKDGKTITWEKHTLDRKFRSEGVAIGDFNKDGKQDIAAGSVYFAAPDWKMVLIRDKAAEYNPEGYSDTFCNFADDLNGDGWTDQIVVGFPGRETTWWENPQTAGGTWTRHVCVPVTNNESPQYLDVDGDGKRELVFSEGDHLALASPTADPKALWKIRRLSQPKVAGTAMYAHGLGVGDVDKDGKQDLITTGGWWKQPADKNADGPWEHKAVGLGDACSQMYAYDFDGDGDNDILSASAHAFGIWWHEQTAEGFKKHLIYDKFSQTHGVCFADVNSDGLPDIITGKRWWAHAKGDPGGDMPAVFSWLSLERKDGQPVWTNHQFDDDSGVGTQFEVGDINGDGLIDVAASNKKGTHVFLQVRK